MTTIEVTWQDLHKNDVIVNDNERWRVLEKAQHNLVVRLRLERVTDGRTLTTSADMRRIVVVESATHYRRRV